MADVVRIYSTSGTTGSPSYIPLTAADLAEWVTISRALLRRLGGQAPATADRLDLQRRPVRRRRGARRVRGARALPHPGRHRQHRAADARRSSVLAPAGRGADPVLRVPPRRDGPRRAASTCAARPSSALLVAGEPGGGEPAMRAQLEAAWGASVTEAMGIGDVAVSLWGECEAQDGMHFSGRGFIHVELIDPVTGASATDDRRRRGRARLHPPHAAQAAPLLRFRSRDHVVVHAGPCACGRTAPRVRCIGRTDDMLIVRGVNVFPTAVREVVSRVRPGGHRGAIQIRPRAARRRRSRRRCRCGSSSPRGARRPGGLAGRSRARMRDALLVAMRGRARALGHAAAQRLQVEARRPIGAENEASTTCASCRARACTTSRWSASDRQTSIDFWEGVLGMPFVFEQPNLDRASREPPLLRPRRRPPDHRLHRRGPQARPAPHPDRPRLRPPPRLRRLRRHLPPGGRAPRRARHRAHRGQGPRLHGLDLLPGPDGPPDRARLLPLRAALGLDPRRRC